MRMRTRFLNYSMDDFVDRIMRLFDRVIDKTGLTRRSAMPNGLPPTGHPLIRPDPMLQTGARPS